MLRFYGPVNPMGSCRARSVYLTTLLLGMFSPLSGYPVLFVCVEVLRPGQPNGVMSSAVSFPNHTLLGRLSPLSAQPILCAFFRQKLTTAYMYRKKRKGVSKHAQISMIQIHPAHAQSLLRAFSLH